MNIQPVSLDQTQVHKLLCTCNGDAALLYIYIHGGNLPANAHSTHRRTSPIQ